MRVDAQGRWIIDMNDYRWAEDRDDFGGIAFLVHLEDRTKRHFVFIRDGEEIGEMIVPPKKMEHN